MATSSPIPVSDYLKTIYRPDCDYIDGELRKRNMGTTPHAALQSFLASCFGNNRRSWGLRPTTEQRVQVTQSRFRIADVCVVKLPWVFEDVLRIAPYLIIEILSPNDALSDMEERVADYLAMGVGHIWLFDPVRRHAWTATPAGFLKLTGDAFEIPGTPVRIPLAEINAELDDIAAGR